MSNEKKSLKINIILNTIYEILIIITPLITTPYVSRILEADGIGTYSFTTSLLSYFTLLAAFGSYRYGKREIARLKDDKIGYSKIFWEIELLVSMFTGVCIIGWLCLSFLYVDYKIYLLILTVNLLAVALDISWLFSGLEKFIYTISINGIFKILGVISVFVFIKSKDDLYIYFIIHALVLALGNLSMWLFLPKTICKCKIDIKNLKHHIKNTAYFFIPAVATTIYTTIDHTLIGLITKDNSQNGYYEQAVKTMNIVKAACYSNIVGVMFSRSSYLHGIGKDEEVHKIMGLTIDMTTFLTVGATFGLIAVAQNFVPLFFGEGYDPTIIILYIMSPILIITCLSVCVDQIYNIPFGKVKQSTIYLVTGSGINLVLNSIMIPFLGVYGACIASLISEFIITFLYIKNSDGMVKMKELFKILWTKIFAGIVMAGSIFGISYLIAPYMPSRALLIVQIIIGIIIYIVSLVILRDKSIKKIYLFFFKRNKNVEN